MKGKPNMKKHVAIIAMLALFGALMVGCSGNQTPPSEPVTEEITYEQYLLDMKRQNTTDFSSFTMESSMLAEGKSSDDFGAETFLYGIVVPMPGYGPVRVYPLEHLTTQLKVDSSSTSVRGYLNQSVELLFEDSDSGSYSAEYYIEGDKAISVADGIISETTTTETGIDQFVTATPTATSEIVEDSKTAKNMVSSIVKTSGPDAITYEFTLDKDAYEQQLANYNKDFDAQVKADPVCTISYDWDGRLIGFEFTAKLSNLTIEKVDKYFDYDATEIPDAPDVSAPIDAADLPGSWDLHEHKNPDEKLGLSPTGINSLRGYEDAYFFMNINEDGSFQFYYTAIMMGGTWQRNDDGTLTFTFEDGTTCTATTAGGAITLTDGDETFVFAKAEESMGAPEHSVATGRGPNESVDILREYLHEQAQQAEGE